MTTEAQREQHERARVLENDRRVREQGSAYIDHYAQEAGGRFSAIGAAQVVGASAVPNYPAAAAHQSDPCGPEPSLGYRIDELEPGSFSPAPNSAFGEVVSSTPLDVERRGGRVGAFITTWI
jgi:hypothetical protein